MGIFIRNYKISKPTKLNFVNKSGETKYLLNFHFILQSCLDMSKTLRKIIFTHDFFFFCCMFVFLYFWIMMSKIIQKLKIVKSSFLFLFTKSEFYIERLRRLLNIDTLRILWNLFARLTKFTYSCTGFKMPNYW